MIWLGFDNTNTLHFLYKVNNLNLNNYDLVIDSTNLTPEQVVKQIKQGYDKFLNK